MRALGRRHIQTDIARKVSPTMFPFRVIFFEVFRTVIHHQFFYFFDEFVTHS